MMDVIAQLVLYIIGFAMFLVGAVALMAIKSDIQVIVAVLAFGFGSLICAAAWVVGDLSTIRAHLRKR